MRQNECGLKQQTKLLRIGNFMHLFTFIIHVILCFVNARLCLLSQNMNELDMSLRVQECERIGLKRRF